MNEHGSLAYHGARLESARVAERKGTSEMSNNVPECPLAGSDITKVVEVHKCTGKEQTCCQSCSTDRAFTIAAVLGGVGWAIAIVLMILCQCTGSDERAGQSRESRAANETVVGQVGFANNFADLANAAEEAMQKTVTLYGEVATDLERATEGTSPPSLHDIARALSKLLRGQAKVHSEALSKK